MSTVVIQKTVAPTPKCERCAPPRSHARWEIIEIHDAETDDEMRTKIDVCDPCLLDYLEIDYTLQMDLIDFEISTPNPR